MKHEEIENVNDEMLDMLIAEHKYVSALFYDDLDRMSARILTELENIDDDAETKDIYMVRLDIDQENKDILAKFGIPDKLPQLGTVSSLYCSPGLYLFFGFFGQDCIRVFAIFY